MRTITVWLSAFNETLITKTVVDCRISASFLSWFLPLIASHGLFAAPLERLSFFVRGNFSSLAALGDGDLVSRQVLIKNIRICIDEVNENYYSVVVSV